MTAHAPIVIQKEHGRPSATCSCPAGRAASHFWSKAAVGEAGECWPWQHGLRRGYGVYWNGARIVGAHRHALILSGQTIAPGLVVDHTCRNRACVNPAHLRAVTRYVNVHENSLAPSHLNSLKTHCVRGHPFSGDNLRLRLGHRECRACVNAWLRAYRARRKEAARG